MHFSCSHMERECDRIKSENDTLLNKALEMHDLLKGLAGRPLPLPPVVAALHNPPSPPLPTRPLPKGSLRGPIMTKAAAKMMMTEQPPPRAGECWSPYMQGKYPPCVCCTAVSPAVRLSKTYFSAFLRMSFIRDIGFGFICFVVFVVISSVLM